MLKPKFLFFSLLLIFTLVSCSTPAEPTATLEPVPTETSVPPTEAPAEPTATAVPLPSPTEEGEAYPPPVPTTDAYPAPTQDTGAYPAPEDQPTPAAPLAVTFPSSDGTLLTGTYYAPLKEAAPVVVLMHQFGSDQHQWDGLALWLQTGIPPAGVEWLPALPEGLSFAVLTFDFRGHGESEGNSGSDAGLLSDAQSAVAFAKTQPGADPNRVITIGTSIGADSAVDACIGLNSAEIADPQTSQGCLGALVLSPGGFVGVNYTQAAEAFLNDPHLAVIYCVAAEDDSSSPLLCDSVTGERYKSVIYPGNAHGLALLNPGLDPDMGALVLEFLLKSLELRQ